MVGDISLRRRALELGAAVAAGGAAGLFAGWLAFGGAAPPAPPGPGAEVARLAASVDRLSETIKRLAEAQSEGRAVGAGRRQDPATRPPAPEPPPIEPGVKFHDTFERGTDGWFVARFAPAIVGEVAHETEEGLAKEGGGALALRYTLEPGKIALVVRTARDVNRLSLWVRTLDRPAEVVVAASERDESSYQTMLHLEPAEGWKRLEFDLTTFVLSDDSTDENDHLDIREIRSLGVLDAVAFLGGSGPNTLLIDEAVGEYREPGAPAAAEERF